MCRICAPYRPRHRFRPIDDDGERAQPVVILNWFKELAEKVPTTE